IVAAERLEFDADRQASLQLRQQIQRLGNVEGARSDKKNEVRLHRPMLGGDGGALDQRQQVALHAFAADVCPRALGARSDLVDLVEKDDAVFLRDAKGLTGDGVGIEQLVG